MGGVSGERLSAQDVACWVLRTSTAPAGIDPAWAPGSRVRLRRCLRASYRLGLMAPGQRCLLWLSGSREPGVHAVGVLAGVPGADVAVDVDLHRLARPVPRSLLLAAPASAGAEVLRAPFGSNPSYLTAAQLAPVAAHLGAEDAAALPGLGWA